MRPHSYPVKTIFYEDERNDEFSGVVRETKTIDEAYGYINRNPIWRFLSVLVHRGIVTPAAYLYCKIKFGLVVRNRQALKPFRKTGCFLYGNHTQVPGDGFLQAMTVFPKKSYVVVNADNVSLKGTEQLMLMIGCMPLPTGLKGYRNFLSAVHERLAQGHPIVIYPEAHIWPYYCGVRPFPATSFAYPVREEKPAFSFTVVYYRRKCRKTPRIEVVVDGPFLPDTTIPHKAAAEQLRRQVYETMLQRTQAGDCEYYRYVKTAEGDEKP